MSTCPKAPGSPHIGPTTGAIAEELGWPPQSSPGVAQLHAKHTNAYSLPPPLDTKHRKTTHHELDTDPASSRHRLSRLNQPLLLTIVPHLQNNLTGSASAIPLNDCPTTASANTKSPFGFIHHASHRNNKNSHPRHRPLKYAKTES